ncbi:heptaprenyl diphosphate synthase component 1 [Seinonella peptonophila]|nr:heptaprenyl diphosphate synthase component 1 [Seinonella peptonophila]
MSVHTSDQKWIEELKSHATEPLVESMIGEANIPLFFTKVIQLLLDSCDIDIERKKRFAIGVTLLQMGLEVHDQIPVHSDSSSAHTASRQLLVLAGDYYSSRYYRLFSLHGELKAIAFFSDRVGEINKSRLNLHLSMLRENRLPHGSYDDLIKFTSGLFAALADFFHVKEIFSYNWDEVIPPLLLVYFLYSRPDWYMEISDSLRKLVCQKWIAAFHKIEHEHDSAIAELKSLFDELSPWVNQHL